MRATTPYEGYEPVRPASSPSSTGPHARQPDQQQQHPAGPDLGAQAWPGHQQAYDDPQAAQQYTQQWQGQTWDTQVQQTRPAASDLAYFPPQNYQAAAQSYDPNASPPDPRCPGTGPAGDGYGPPTLAGNARITDAQRARRRGVRRSSNPGCSRPPSPRYWGCCWPVTAQVGSYALVVPLVILQAVTAAGWFRLNGMWPARQGIALAFAGALVADVALLAAGRENGPPRSSAPSASGSC
jgi:hypothetical protein